MSVESIIQDVSTDVEGAVAATGAAVTGAATAALAWGGKAVEAVGATVESVLAEELGLTGGVLTSTVTAIEALGSGASVSAITTAITTTAEAGGLMVTEVAADAAAVLIAPLVAL